MRARLSDEPGRRRLWAWVRLAGGVLILAVVVARVGAGAFVDAIRLTSVPGLVAAAAVTAVTTLCAAWRWRLVARGLGADLPLLVAVRAYYRSQFLNVTLPGGVLGDVHRAVSHGRDEGDLGRGLRAVAWERSAGQVVQIVLTLVALLLLPSPLHSSLPTLTLVAVEAVLVLLLVAFVLRGTRGLPSRVVRAIFSDVRRGLLARPLWPGILLASSLAVVGHVLVFLLAAHTAGVDASTGRLLPLALIVLLASAIPMNVAGWGPREGAAAWAFGAAGLGATQGATVSVVFGVMVLVAALPGAVLLLADWLAAPARRQAVPPDGRYATRPVREVTRG
jgi:uncharacterized membrane protein YbhN (UPF0104 family)